MIARSKILSALVLGLSPVALFAPATGHAQISIGFSVDMAPPPLPVYVQPPIPAPDYLWTPGYWAWDDWWGDYYWVPGTWVQAPRPGYLWTPGYWGWNNGNYVWNAGYWGSHVGFYGGIDYGYGYTSAGFFGGQWNGGHFSYNRAVTNIGGNNHITNVYNQTVINNVTNNGSHAAFSGGPGGVHAQPTPEQRRAMTEPHLAPTPVQSQHVKAAQADRSSFASVNKGRPAVLAVAHPRPAPAGPIHPPGPPPARSAAAAAHGAAGARPAIPAMAGHESAPAPHRAMPGGTPGEIRSTATEPGAAHGRPDAATEPAHVRPDGSAEPVHARPDGSAEPAHMRPDGAAEATHPSTTEGYARAPGRPAAESHPEAPRQFESAPRVQPHPQPHPEAQPHPQPQPHPHPAPPPKPHADHDHDHG